MAALSATELLLDGAPDISPEALDLVQNFDGINDQFRIIGKTGEGTFSCVFKAIDLHSPNQTSLVAVKRIHATSSPARIKNELEILATLHTSKYICSVVTAMRCRDQVVIVMPYVEFTDFREMYNTCDLTEVQMYMYQLLKALGFTASKNVIHRDVKPTNFLYNRKTQRGVLVDFGLAEFDRSKSGDCACQNHGISGINERVSASQLGHVEGGYRKDDTRPARRANRAGTRGFRAPEVLLKCNRQSHKVDVWASGVVLLMFLAKRFPFFTSMDDSDALVEIASIYGRREMRAVANLHGAEFETNLPTISEHRHSWLQIVDWCNERSEKRKSNSSHQPSTQNQAPVRSELETEAIDLLDWLMELDVRKRPGASEALSHPFLSNVASKLSTESE